jgi:hypothetical protein
VLWAVPAQAPEPVLAAAEAVAAVPGLQEVQAAVVEAAVSSSHKQSRST